MERTRHSPQSSPLRLRRFSDPPITKKASPPLFPTGKKPTLFSRDVTPLFKPKMNKNSSSVHHGAPEIVVNQ